MLIRLPLFVLNKFGMTADSSATLALLVPVIRLRGELSRPRICADSWSNSYIYI